MHRQRPHTHRRQLFLQPEPMQHTRGIRTDLDSRTHLADRLRLLVHMHIEPGLMQRERRSEAADPATDDRNRRHIAHRRVDDVRFPCPRGERICLRRPNAAKLSLCQKVRVSA